MASLYVGVLLTCLIFINVANGVDLQVGTSVNMQLAYTENVKLSAVPLVTRTKNVFYSDANNKAIKGISAIDIDNSEAQAIITSGGVGSTYVNIRIKSQRGDGLNYLVQIFI